MSLPKTLSDRQDEVATWHRRNFGEPPPEWLALIVAEEAGEVCRAILKLVQGIRGGEEVWRPQVASESADVLIALLALADRMGFDLEQAFRERWAVVSQRRFGSAAEELATRGTHP